MTIPQARKQFDDATKALSLAVKRAFPKGRFVSVTLGKARVILEVTGHSDSYHRPGYVYGRNITTGKSRAFSATYHEATLLGAGVR